MKNVYKQNLMKNTLLMTMVAAVLSFTACNDDSSQLVNPETLQTPGFEISRATYPEDDGSSEVPGQPHEKVARLLMNSRS
jgi:hypothetical protein